MVMIVGDGGRETGREREGQSCRVREHLRPPSLMLLLLGRDPYLPLGAHFSVVSSTSAVEQHE